MELKKIISSTTVIFLFNLSHGFIPRPHMDPAKNDYRTIYLAMFDIGLLYRYSCSMSSSYTGMIVRYRTAEAKSIVIE